MEMKYQDMGKRPYLLVPVIDERHAEAPVTPIDSLVYGYLVYLARKNNATSRTAMATTLRLDKNAVDRSVAHLIDGGAVVEEGSRIRAVEPQGKSVDWFRRMADTSNKAWQERWVYDKVYLPRSSETLSVRTNLLFWHLVRLGHPVDGMPGHLQVGGNQVNWPKFLTLEYLAKGLGCAPKTIRRGLRRLKELDLLKTQSVEDGFVVGLTPIRERASLWRDGWKTTRKKEVTTEVTAKSLFGVPSNDILKPSTLYDAGAGRYIRAYGIKGQIGEQIVTKIVKHRIEPRYWQLMLETARRDHEGNREKDPAKYPMKHCGFLFKHMLDEHVVQEEARCRIQRERTYLGYAEMNARPMLENLRMTDRSMRLLYQAIRVEHLDLRGGACVPCRLNWEFVEAMLKQAGKDFDLFKKMVAESIFVMSEEMPACDWLDQWMAEKQIPVLDNSPMVTLGLDSKERGLVQMHATRVAERKVGKEDMVARNGLVNDLIRLACWQATKKVPSHLEEWIDDISSVLFPEREQEVVVGGSEADEWRRKLDGVSVWC